MVATSFLTILLFAFTIAIAAAKPALERRSPIKVPLKRHSLVNHNVVEHDKRRVKSRNLKISGKNKNNDSNSSSESNSTSNTTTQTNFEGVLFGLNISCGDPPTFYITQIDSGSSNTWVGANKAYVPTKTSHNTTNKVKVSYGSGFFKGFEFTDQVTIGPGLVISNQSIGVATKSQGFPGIDGIIGIGPIDLTVGTLGGHHQNSTIPTVTDSLFASGAIPEHLVAVFFPPFNNVSSNDDNSNNDNINVLDGELTWGGIDTSRFIGDIMYTPITQTAPSSSFWGIDASVTYGSVAILSSTAGIVDTGTTLTLLATDAFLLYQNVTGGVPDRNTGLLTVTSAQFKSMKSLSFVTSNTSVTLNRDAQFWPQHLNAILGGVANKMYLTVQDLGSKSGQGLDFTIGMTSLQRYYIVFDTANQQIGFAQTSFTNETINTST